MSIAGLFYCRIFCHGGYGIHSPFVYDLVTNVIEERCRYYYYDKIEALYDKYKRQPINGKYRLTESEGRTLYRLAIRFRPHEIFLTGEVTDFPMMCLSHDDDAIANRYVDGSQSHIEHSLESAFRTDDSTDCLYIDGGLSPDLQLKVFDCAFPGLHDRSFCIIPRIHVDSGRNKLWQTLCNHPRITTSVDCYRMGLLFLRPDLPKQTFKCSL